VRLNNAFKTRLKRLERRLPRAGKRMIILAVDEDENPAFGDVLTVILNQERY